MPKSDLDFVSCDSQDLISALDRAAFLGLPRTCNIRSDPWESFVTREMSIGSVLITASYYIKANSLMLCTQGSIQFWSGDKPEHIEYPEDLAEFAAARLIEHLTSEFEED